MTRYGIRKLNERCDSRISSFNFLAPGSRPVVAEAVFKSGERCMKDGALACMMQTDPQTRPKSCSEIGLQAAEMTVSAHELRAHLFHQYLALTYCLG
ncbi:hypothetical protein KCU93_g311, partial [Aureobasidium melanogenum]